MQKGENMEILAEIFQAREDEERALMHRNPWIPRLYNYMIAVLIILLFVSLFVWGMQIRIDHKASNLAAVALADYQAEQQAEADAKAAELAAYQRSEQFIQQQQTSYMAKLFYGVKRFQDKYGYNDKDFETLARCVFNRVESKSYSGDMIEVINQKDQWVGYYENNPVLDEYYKLADQFIQTWKAEQTKPVSTDYVFAELTPNGIWLKNDFHADGYARRWRAS